MSGFTRTELASARRIDACCFRGFFLGSRSLKQLGVEFFDNAEVGDFGGEVAVMFLLRNQDAVNLLVVAKGDFSEDVASNALDEYVPLLVEVQFLSALRADNLYAHGSTAVDLGLLVQQGHFVVGVLQPQHLAGAEEL